MTIGFITIHRKIQDNHLWLSEPFSRGQAWVDLIMLANFKETSYFIRGNLVVVPRGCLAISEKKLSDRWRWSKAKTRGYLKHLESEHQIKQQKSNVINRIEVVNYEEYQHSGQQNEQQEDYRTTTERPHHNKGLRSMTEHDIQKSIIVWCTMCLKNAFVYAVPNGGQRHIAVARKLKAEGQRAGVASSLTGLHMFSR